MNFVLRTHEIYNNAKIPKEKIVLQCLRRQEIESYVNELTALHALYIYINTARLLNANSNRNQYQKDQNICIKR